MPMSCSSPHRRPHRTPPAGAVVRLTLFFLVPCLALSAPASAQELEDARKLFDGGKYAECMQACAAAIEAGERGSAWWVLKIEAELTLGQYPQALTSYASAVDLYETSLPLRLLGVEALRRNGKPDDAELLLGDIRLRAERTPWRYNDAAGRVALGRAMLLTGADAREVLQQCFDRAKKIDPASGEPYKAAGELALEKHDYAMAAEAYRDAIRRAPDDADARFGLARAFANDAEQATAALAKALELNPRHVGSLLFQAENAIDGEDYERAEALLTNVLEINPRHAGAWAYRAVLAHLAGDRKREEACRTEALGAWTTNPEVDHLIGRKLSQEYRFAEGEARQRAALRLVPAYRPAKVQLCQDLLRLGKEEGWALAAEVFAEDRYDVMAFNLITLQETLSKFRTLSDAHFLVRMDPREADIYGQRVQRLLARARAKLCEKYGVELAGPVTIEIFPSQKDFAIRTFGLPGGDGFLGVCFGPVVTVNSPASRAAHPANWEAILWHEFCHTVTLAKTRNKMPRWLSEGISVYEERLENPAWGQSMTPQYRQIILAGGATPVSKLSGAFLKPPTPMHLQFAYYESSMVVEFINARFGASALRNVLTDLGNDVPINVALAKHTEPIEQLDKRFDKWLRERAEALGPEAVWAKPDLPLDADSAAMAAWNKENPSNFWGLLGEGRALIAERSWQEAKGPLERAINLHAGYGEAGGPYLLMAAAHRGLNESAQERQMLDKHIALDADAIEPRERLMELATSANDWPAVRGQAEQVLAVNPLIPSPHRHLARSAEASDERPLAIEARRTLLLLDPLGKAEHHFRLASLLVADGQLPAARREVLLSLEEAPRYRAAHKLLLDIAAQMPPAPTTAPVDPAAPLKTVHGNAAAWPTTAPSHSIQPEVRP